MNAFRTSLASLLVVGLGACATAGPRDASATIRSALANEQQLDAAKFPPRSVAVLPIAAPPGDTTAEALSWALSEMLSQDLARNRSLQVLERRRIGALLQEIAAAGSERFDARTAPRAGRLLGARRVAAGDVSMLRAGEYRVTLRAVDVATGEQSGALSETFKLDDVLAAESSLYRQLALALGVRPRLDAAPRSSITPEALVRFGRGVEALARGNVAVGQAELTAAAKASPTLETAARSAREPAASGGAAGAGDDRRSRLRDVAAIVQPLAPVRTAEAADVAAAAVVRTVTLGLIIILP
jgi:TolB-like protein